MDMKDYAGALADSDSAYQLNPNRTGTLINKGYIFFYDGIMEQLSKIITTHYVWIHSQ